MFLVDEIDKYDREAREHLAREQWPAIVELVPWDRLNFMFGQVTTGKLSGHLIDRVAVLVHIRSYADLMLHNGTPATVYGNIVATISHIHAINTSTQFSQRHRTMFEIRMSQCHAARGDITRAHGTGEMAFNRTMRTRNQHDIAMARLVLATLARREAMQTTAEGDAEDAANHLRNALANAEHALNALRRVPRERARVTEPLYRLACLWAALIHKQLGNKWRAGIYAAMAKCLHWRNRAWVIDFSATDRHLPFALPVGM